MLVREMRLKGYTDNSISTMTAEVNNVLNLAVEFEVLDQMPTWPRLKAVAAKKELLTPEEVVAVINAVDKGAFTHQYQTMIRLQFELALRVSELIGLTVGKIDLEKGTVLIDQQRLPGRGFQLGPTKTNSSTVLPLSPSLIEELRPYVEERPPEVPLWISARLQPVSRSSYDFSLRAAVKSAGIQKSISSHCLRASCLDYLVNHTNLSIMAVSHLARHSPTMLVSHYAQVDQRVVNDYFSSKKSLEETLSCNVVAMTGTDGR
jgi:integrase